ncbi:MAG: carbohydrate binding family 9 protein [Chitinophagaceae bacterium]|nr:carbohydrate binding family 9 protein [Chitinophagaceae bacterium]
MRRLFVIFFTLLASFSLQAQVLPKQLNAKRTTATIKIDGNIDEAAWKEAVPASDFFEWRPNAGKHEDAANRTIVYLLYDNTSIYIGGYCYERTRDSISKELVGRDLVGVNDFVGVILDSYNDKINAVGFYVTPYGEQFDAKYSNSDNGEDASWNAVWDSEAKVHADGWSFEMRIPYSALRFSNRADQTWGLNITRRRNKTGQQYMWNPVDPKVNGFINQEGLWTGIEKIEAPLRLSFSPYLSVYANHYPYNTTGVKNWSSSVNGGMDVKYGITEGFTLDMTLVPDFGQVQSDNQVLNLSPFEVKYNENRSFFTEGTELFNKGNLFYSRRIGSQPIHYYDVQDTSADHIHKGEHFITNPIESKLINATKVSGRTKNGLGIGFFNALTKPMYAVVKDDKGNSRKIETSPLTNYNIMVLDQTLKNNSAVSVINTNVTRSGSEPDANVTAALFNLNNKKNTYNWNGKFSVSQLTQPGVKNTAGYSHSLGFAKTGGRWNFQLQEELVDSKYDINDMGILFNNNYLDHSFWTGYRWLKPTNWYNRVQVNMNANYSVLYNRFPGQFTQGKFQRASTNVNANAQLKNLWFIGVFLGYVPESNDFYEPHQAGYVFSGPVRKQFSAWFETNAAKKYYASFSYFVGIRSLFNSPNHQFIFSHRYRFSDKFSLTHDLNYNPTTNDAGFYQKYFSSSSLQDIIFSRRDLNTVENILRAKYNFNYRSGVTIRVRHYWSKVEPKQLYDLGSNGSLSPTKHSDVAIRNQNYNIFNVDAVYTWQFAPGSFLNVVWKDESFVSDGLNRDSYFTNLDHTLASPQNNNLSIKLIYYLDYLNFKKRAKK